jgi:hypothetical protein
MPGTPTPVMALVKEMLAVKRADWRGRNPNAWRSFWARSLEENGEAKTYEAYSILQDVLADQRT